MEVKMKPYGALPCSLQEFTINGIRADQDDFGEGGDSSPETAEPYGCGCWEFKADRTPKQEVLDKYGITKEEYLTICDQLEDKVMVGECGWCV